MGQLRTCRGTRSGRHWANSAHCQLSVTSSALASSVSGTVRPSALLEAIADKLRALDYLPIVFDFDRPTDRDLTETVKVLAGLSLFVVVDITNPRSVPLELQATVPDYMVPFVTLVERGQPVFGMFDDLPRKCDWALPLLESPIGIPVELSIEGRIEPLFAIRPSEHEHLFVVNHFPNGCLLLAPSGVTVWQTDVRHRADPGGRREPWPRS